MNTPDSRLRTLSLDPWSPVRRPISDREGRLVVIVSGVSGEAALASRILVLAEARGLKVLLVGVSPATAQETELRRKLVTVAAFIGADRWPVEIVTEHGKDWLDRVTADCRQDDQIACYAEQGISVRGDLLSDVLSRRLLVPIHDLSGLQLPQMRGRGVWSQAFAWLGSIAAIIGFFMLQTRIVLATQGGTQSVLLLFTLLIEAGAIWLWNSFFG